MDIGQTIERDSIRDIQKHIKITCDRHIYTYTEKKSTEKMDCRILAVMFAIVCLTQGGLLKKRTFDWVNVNCFR